MVLVLEKLFASIHVEFYAFEFEITGSVTSRNTDFSFYAFLLKV